MKMLQIPSNVQYNSHFSLVLFSEVNCDKTLPNMVFAPSSRLHTHTHGRTDGSARTLVQSLSEL